MKIQASLPEAMAAVARQNLRYSHSEGVILFQHQLPPSLLLVAPTHCVAYHWFGQS
jgi:hypothetical protein